MNVEQSHDPFIPSELDDAGLPTNQFRVLCHLWRRGETFSSAATIARVCRLKRDTVFEVLTDLEKAGFIRRTSRPGQTTLIQPVPFGGMGRNDNPPRFGGQEVSRSGGRHPSRLGGHKGNTIKEIPLRKSRGVKKEEPIIQLPFTSEAFKESWNEWQQHCREKKKTITPTSMNRQFKKFLGWGEGRSIAAISLSVESNWQGIFESSATTSKKSNPLKADDYKL